MPVTFESTLLACPWTADTVKLELASASVSFAKTPLPALTVSCLSSLTDPVSAVPTGASFTPLTVISIVALLSVVPSDAV